MAQANLAYKKAIYDLSFAGSSFVIDGVQIDEFMDDANPIDIQDTDVCNIEWSCNGKMIRTIKPSAVIVSVTVIPGSGSDRALRKIWKKNFCNTGDVSVEDANRGLSASINIGRKGVDSFSFYGGTCVSGAAAMTSNGQGKMGGNTYTFAFSKVA